MTYAKVRNFFRTPPPETFEARGCFIPFTTPGLFGARLRRGVGGEPEVVVMTTGAGRGSMVVPLTHLGRIGLPSVFDRWLADHLPCAVSFDPPYIWEVLARGAALGLAGVEAAEAAEGFIVRRERNRKALASFLPALCRGEKAPGSGGRKGAAGDLLLCLDLLGLRSDFELAHFRLWLRELRHFQAEMQAHAGGMRQRSRLAAAFLAYWSALLAGVLDTLAEGLTPSILSSLLREAPRVDPAPLGERLLTPLRVFDGWPFILAAWRKAREEGEKIAVIEDSLDILPPLPRSICPKIAWPEGFDTINEGGLPSAVPPLTLSRNETLRAMQHNEKRLAGFFRDWTEGGGG